ERLQELGDHELEVVELRADRVHQDQRRRAGARLQVAHARPVGERCELDLAGRRPRAGVIAVRSCFRSHRVPLPTTVLLFVPRSRDRALLCSLGGSAFADAEAKIRRSTRPLGLGRLELNALTAGSREYPDAVAEQGWGDVDDDLVEQAALKALRAE